MSQHLTGLYSLKFILVFIILIFDIVLYGILSIIRTSEKEFRFCRSFINYYKNSIFLLTFSPLNRSLFFQVCVSVNIRFIIYWHFLEILWLFIFIVLYLCYQEELLIDICLEKKINFEIITRIYFCIYIFILNNLFIIILSLL